MTSHDERVATDDLILSTAPTTPTPAHTYECVDQPVACSRTAEYVHFCPCDEGITVAIPVSVLDMFHPHLMNTVQHTPPTTDLKVSHHPFWRTHMTADLLRSVAMTMAHSRLECIGNVKPGLVTRELGFQGVHCDERGVNASRKSELGLKGDNSALNVVPPRGAKCIQLSVPNSLMKLVEERLSEESRMKLLCAQIAHAVTHCPSLGNAADSVYDGYEPFSVSPSRAWVRFVTKPPLEGSRKRRSSASQIDQVINLCMEWPKWLGDAAIAGIGIAYDFVDAGRGRKRRSKVWNAAEQEASLNHVLTLTDSVKNLAGHYWCSMHDCSERHTLSMPPQGRRERRVYVTRIVETLREAGGRVVDPKDPNDTVNFGDGDLREWARAWIVMLIDSVRHSPQASSIFSGACAIPGGDGSTPERDQLAEAFALYNVRLLAWHDECPVGVVPFDFPPSWAVQTPPDTVAQGPCMLLDWSR